MFCRPVFLVDVSEHQMELLEAPTTEISRELDLFGEKRRTKEVPDVLETFLFLGRFRFQVCHGSEVWYVLFHSNDHHITSQ